MTKMTDAQITAQTTTPTAQPTDRGLVTETVAVIGAGGTTGFPIARSIARGAGIVITMLADEDAVIEAMDGQDGALRSWRRPASATAHRRMIRTGRTTVSGCR